MSKINIQPLSRLISSTKIIDDTMNISSLAGRFRNYRQNKLSLKQIQHYYSDHSQKHIKEQAVSIYHQLREAHSIKDIVTMARLLSPLLFKEWRLNPNVFHFYNNMANVEIMRIRVNKQEVEYGVWGQVLVKYVHQSEGRGYVEKQHLLERKLIVEDNNEGWRMKIFQN